jgi:hypothetical protein
LSICLDKIARPGDDSPALPGALLVDPFVRSVAQREGLKVAENAVWLVMVGMREYVKSLLKNTIASTKAINEGHELPDASALIRSIGPVAKERSAIFEGTKHTAAPPKSGKRKCLSTLDLAAYLMASPVTCGRGNNGLASEQCYTNAFDPLLVTSQSGFEALQGYIASGIETSFPKKHTTEKDPNFLPPGASAAQAKNPPQQPLPPVTAQQTKPSPNVASPISQPKAEELSTKEGAASKPPNANNLLRSPNVKGMGRGAKNLAALKARAAAAASAAKDEEAKVATSSAAQSTEVKIDSFQPPTQSATQSQVNPTTPKNVETQVPSVANAEPSKPIEGTLQPKPQQQMQQSSSTPSASTEASTGNPAPIEEKSADSSRKVDSSASETNAATPELPTSPPAASSAAIGARRGGRGFGVKNLAMMRARSVVEEPKPEDAAPAEPGNPTETPAQEAEELKPSVDPAKATEASNLAAVPEPAAQEVNPAVDVEKAEEVNIPASTAMLYAEKAKPVTDPSGDAAVSGGPAGGEPTAEAEGESGKGLNKVVEGTDGSEAPTLKVPKRELDAKIDEGGGNPTEVLAPATPDVGPVLDPTEVGKESSSPTDASAPTVDEAESNAGASKAGMDEDHTEAPMPVAGGVNHVTEPSESTKGSKPSEEGAAHVADPGKAEDFSDAFKVVAPAAEGGKPDMGSGKVDEDSNSSEEGKLDEGSKEGEEGSILAEVLTSEPAEAKRESHHRAKEEDDSSSKYPAPATGKAKPDSDREIAKEGNDSVNTLVAEEAKSDSNAKATEEDGHSTKVPASKLSKPDKDPEATDENTDSSKVPAAEKAEPDDRKAPEADNDSSKAPASVIDAKPDSVPKAAEEHADSPKGTEEEIPHSVPEATKEEGDSPKDTEEEILDSVPEATKEEGDPPKGTEEEIPDSVPEATKEEGDPPKGTEEEIPHSVPEATKEEGDSPKDTGEEILDSVPEATKEEGDPPKGTEEEIPDSVPEATEEEVDSPKGTEEEIPDSVPDATKEEGDSPRGTEEEIPDSVPEATKEEGDSFKGTEEAKPDVSPGNISESAIEEKDAASEAKDVDTGNAPDDVTLKIDDDPGKTVEDTSEAKDGKAKASEDATSEKEDGSEQQKEVTNNDDAETNAQPQLAEETESNSEKSVVEVGVEDEATGDDVAASTPKDAEEGQASKRSSTGEDEAKVE